MDKDKLTDMYYCMAQANLIETKQGTYWAEPSNIELLENVAIMMRMWAVLLEIPEKSS